jgi:hypothetical protein
MARLPNLNKDQLKPEDLKYYDVIAESRGGVRGPYGVLLHSTICSSVRSWLPLRSSCSQGRSRKFPSRGRDKRSVFGAMHGIVLDGSRLG